MKDPTPRNILILGIIIFALILSLFIYTMTANISEIDGYPCVKIFNLKGKEYPGCDDLERCIESCEFTGGKYRKTEKINNGKQVVCYCYFDNETRNIW